MTGAPELILICCEGSTEMEYFNILKRRFRLPTYIKVLPGLATDYHHLDLHEHLIAKAREKKAKYSTEFEIPEDLIEVWAVCDRDDYGVSCTVLNNFAISQNVMLAFSDPQFENFLLQHFSLNDSTNRKNAVEMELSQHILGLKPQYAPYHKGELVWLDEMIDKKHVVVKNAIRNANNFENHTKIPFFTVQKLVERLLQLTDSSF